MQNDVCVDPARTALIVIDMQNDFVKRGGHLLVPGAEATVPRSRACTGETVRKRSVATRDDLTPQEWQIAELARDGLSNPEIGARLFLGRRTVEWHLRHVFAKLGIRSRRELSSALAGSVSALVTT